MCGIVRMVYPIVVIGLLQLVCYVCAIMDEHGFKHSFNTSYAECTEACGKQIRCSWSKYTRRYQLCELFDNTTSTFTGNPGTNVHLKQEKDLPVECANCTSPGECTKRTDGTWICTVNNCGKPPTLQKAKTLGNIYKIGSKIRYECNSISSTVECLANGSWTYSDLECPCTPLVIPYGNIELRRSNRGIYKARLVGCDYGFEPRHATQALICNPLEDEWTGDDDVYCDKMIDGQWMKIYTLPKDSDEGVVNAWKFGNISSARYAYTDHSFIDNWEAMAVGHVKLRVVKDDIEVAFITFDGRNSTSYSWFSKDRLLQSSWIDMNLSSIAHMDWYGILNKESEERVNIRHPVLQTLDEMSCEGDVGWFAVTRRYYPCDTVVAESHTNILYAKGNNASSFLTDEIGMADRFEVWVTLTT